MAFSEILRQNFERISQLLLAVIDEVLKERDKLKNKVVGEQVELKGNIDPRMYKAGE